MFAPFVADMRGKIDAADFLAGVIAIMMDKHSMHNGVSIEEIQRKFLFQVYDYGHTGALVKENMFKILQLAYGKSSAEACAQQVDALFGAATAVEIEDFAAYDGDIRLLVDWVRTCYGALLNSQSPKLDELEKR